jgi:hypothetical protein
VIIRHQHQHPDNGGGGGDPTPTPEPNLFVQQIQSTLSSNNTSYFSRPTATYIVPNFKPNPKDYPQLVIPVTDIDATLPQAPFLVRYYTNFLYGDCYKDQDGGSQYLRNG